MMSKKVVNTVSTSFNAIARQTSEEIGFCVLLKKL